MKSDVDFSSKKRQVIDIMEIPPSCVDSELEIKPNEAHAYFLTS